MVKFWERAYIISIVIGIEIVLITIIWNEFNLKNFVMWKTPHQEYCLCNNKKPGRDKMKNILKDYKEQVRIRFNHDERWVQGYIKYNDKTFMRLDVVCQSYQDVIPLSDKSVIIPIYSIKFIELMEDKPGEGSK